MKLSNNQQAFFTLVKAGLWGKEARLSHIGDIDYSNVMQIAEEQSVVGLVTAGLECVSDVKIPKEVVLQFIGCALQIEQRNKAMNEFVASLIEKLSKEDITVVLVKGQGIAQCYEKPLWRSSGDVDLLLDEINYEKAKKLLRPLASYIEIEYEERLHQALTISNWEVEIHGTFRCMFWKSLDKQIDDVQRDIFNNGNMRLWQNGYTQVLLPNADNDAVLLFTHILQHFYKGGVGLRQICDWCRLMWVYQDSINTELLNCRLANAGILSEWKALAALVVDYLGMPVETIPLYSDSLIWKRKGERILGIILDKGNFGHNKDVSSYKKKSYMRKKAHSFWMHSTDNLQIFFIFPFNSLKVWLGMTKYGLRVALKGK